MNAHHAPPPGTTPQHAPSVAPALDGASLTALRAPAVRHLLQLRARGKLSRTHVATTAQCLDVSDRTVWRWLADASADPATAVSPGARRATRFEITPELRVLLAYWHGNASAVHRELLARARQALTPPPPPADTDSSTPGPAAPPPRAAVPGGAPPTAVPLLDPVPSLATFLRAVRRDLTAGERAGYRHGPEAARSLDVFATRLRAWRNEVWEADHVQAPLRVDADGSLLHPYVTWFIDCATKAVTGVAVTPHTPTRASVLAALRSAIVRTDPYGPFGGLPEHVRFDRGRDVLSRTVSTALTALDADITVLPPYSPHLKGSIENLNHCATAMLFAALPGYTPKKPRRRPDRRPQTAPPMSFTAFTEELLAWAQWWNTEHHPAELHGATPLEAWQADPTPLNDVPATEVWTFTLEDDGRTRTITSHGVRFRNRDYIADWMTGQAGRKVTVRFMPHHTHEIEICDLAGRRLCTAHLADQATDEQRAALRHARTRRARRLRAEAEAAEQLRHTRFAPATEATQARRLDTVTATEAARELAQHPEADLTALALPDLIPPAPPPADWAISDALKARTRPAGPAPDSACKDTP
ncbi:Mu transposase C-terminal domain-containing protein [Streptomyces sp. NPDC001407]|uniref:Mu transposase C-terminal domain-containing protein n=1 Tax=Streptomyces sp. NPDC001407 TaxID=3364573 RepID=UPI0036CA9432